MIPGPCPGMRPPLDLSGDPVRLVRPGRERRLADGQRAAPSPVRDQALDDPALDLEPIRIVEPDQAIGRVEDRRARPVVAPHDDHPRVPEVRLEVDDRARRRAAEPVDGLVVVAHHGDVPVRLRDDRHELCLGSVDVLELVHEHVPEAGLEVPTSGRMLPQEREREAHLVAEVDRAGLAEQLLVPPVRCGELRVTSRLLPKGGRARRLHRPPRPRS